MRWGRARPGRTRETAVAAYQPLIPRVLGVSLAACGGLAGLAAEIAIALRPESVAGIVRASAEE